MHGWAQTTTITIVTILVVSFQIGFLPLIDRLLSHSTLLWPAVYYLFWLVALGLSFFWLATSGRVRRASLPIILVSIVSVALALMHPIGWVTKNFVVSMVMLSAVTVLSLGSSPFLLLRLAAWSTAFNALACFLDAFYVDGFTNSAGRGAGLGINPNVAGAMLVIGAAASFWAVSARWRPSFLVLIAAAIFVTLSRSTLLVGMGVVVVSAVVTFVAHFELPRGWTSLRLAIALGVALFALIVTLTVVNHRFLVAASHRSAPSAR